jgi:hypothetical protein
MAATTQFYLDQAAQCARDASAAALSNQRDTLLRAEAAWLAMAARTSKVATERDRREAAKLG